jgi:hypothetical protein
MGVFPPMMKITLLLFLFTLILNCSGCSVSNVTSIQPSIGSFGTRVTLKGCFLINATTISGVRLGSTVSTFSSDDGAQIISYNSSQIVVVVTQSVPVTPAKCGPAFVYADDGPTPHAASASSFCYASTGFHFYRV